jgi:hypothetical protein
MKSRDGQELAGPAQLYGFKDKAIKKYEKKKKGVASFRDCSVCQRTIINLSTLPRKWLYTALNLRV